MMNRGLTLLRWTLPLLLLQLSACGFHLRGAVPLPAVMQKTYIVGASGSDLYFELENALINAGAEVVDSAADATAVLTLLRNKTERRVVSVDARGRAAEYELTLQVAFSLRDRAGRRIAEQERVSVVRDFSFDPDNVLAKGDEEAALRSEMNRIAVAQMMRRLQSLTRSSAPATKE